MGLPYFVSGTAWLLIIGVALMAMPYFVRVAAITKSTGDTLFLDHVLH